METVGTVNFEDLFDFSPEPLDSPLENSSAEKLDQDNYDQFTHLINQGIVQVESGGSNRSQSSQLSSPPAAGIPFGVIDDQALFAQNISYVFFLKTKNALFHYRVVRSISSGVHRQGQTGSQAQLKNVPHGHEDQVGMV